MLGGGIYPGMITATIGTFLLVAVVVDVGGDRPAPPSLRGLVRRASRRVRRNCACLVPPDPDRQRARAGPRRGRLLARAVPRHARRARLVPAARAGSEGAPASSPRRRGRRRRRRSRLASHHRTSPRPPQRPRRAVLPLALRRPKRWWASHPFSLSAAPDGRSLRITAKALGDFSARMADIRPGTRVVAEGPFGVFTEAARRREKVAADRGRDRDHADPRADGGHVRRCGRRLSRGQRGRRRSSATSWRRSRASVVSALEIVAGDHRTPDGARC